MAQEWLLSKTAVDPNTLRINGYSLLLGQSERSEALEFNKYNENVLDSTQKNRAFAFMEEGNMHVGISGYTGDVLGWDHAYAYERTSPKPDGSRGRRIPFSYMLQLEPGEPVPDISELRDQLPERLEAALDKAHASPRALPVQSTTSLQATSKLQGAWAKLIEDVQNGKPGVGVLQNEKAVQWLEVNTPKAAAAAKATQEKAAPKASDGKLKMSRNTVIIGAIILTSAAGLAWVARELMRRDKQQDIHRKY